MNDTSEEGETPQGGAGNTGHVSGTVALVFKHGWVYVAGGAEGPVKIGWTMSPAKRMSTLQNACPFELSLFGAFRGRLADEQRLHERFKHLRIRANGEWFTRDETLGLFIVCLSSDRDVRMDQEFDWALGRERW